MRPKASSEALAEQLYLLTLATEQALVKEDWVESDALFRRRDEILTKLESMLLTEAAITRLGEVQRIESELASSLKRWKSSLVEQITAGKRERKAVNVYGNRLSHNAFDATG